MFAEVARFQPGVAERGDQAGADASQQVRGQCRAVADHLQHHLVLTGDHGADAIGNQSVALGNQQSSLDGEEAPAGDGEGPVSGSKAQPKKTSASE